MLVVFAAATALTLSDVRLASSQTVTLVAKRSEVPIPMDDPSADVWKRGAPVEVPLSGQNVVAPMAGSAGTVKARALHDGERLYIRVEWSDETEDISARRAGEFSDAAAVQFPVTEGEQVPSFCMGNPDAPVNIWQWKAAWQVDVEEGFVDVLDVYPNTFVDLYPFEDEDEFYPPLVAGNVPARPNRVTAADNLLAGSFGTLTPAEDQIVQGKGVWEDGRWLVVFARDLTTDGEYAQFAEGGSANVAFAVWDGDSDERDGMKSVSQFLTLDVSSEIAEAPSGGLPIWAIILIVLGGLALVAALGGAYVVQRRSAA
jgi:hypothetical protein